MLDINLIRTNPDKVRQALLKRLDVVDLEPVLALDRKRRELRSKSNRKRKGT